MEIKPLFDRVLLKPYKEEKSTHLLTPDDDEGNKMQVVSVGTNNNFIIKKDDIVLINSYSGNQFTIDKNANHDRHIWIQLLDDIAISNGTIVWSHSCPTLWRIGIFRTQTFSCCIVIHHRIHTPRSHSKEQAWSSYDTGGRGCHRSAS